ncbi:purple acid phosphatase [Striga asiatica]|uniref:Purple acid phosphatase n=1 Tax=Striga asiatica TaxID=4170 RepID=A0A5A7PFL9_STRAF|nr:purple acid phosphatase [Striga asiatica]
MSGPKSDHLLSSITEARYSLKHLQMLVERARLIQGGLLPHLDSEEESIPVENLKVQSSGEIRSEDQNETGQVYLHPVKGDLQDPSASHKTLDLASSLEVGPTNSNSEKNNRLSLLENDCKWWLVKYISDAHRHIQGCCFVEGEWLRNAFRWKETIGPWEERPGHFVDVWHYWTDDGFGHLEFLQLAEDLGTAPIWVFCNVEIFMQVQSKIHPGHNKTTCLKMKSRKDDKDSLDFDTSSEDDRQDQSSFHASSRRGYHSCEYANSSHVNLKPNAFTVSNQRSGNDLSFQDLLFSFDPSSVDAQFGTSKSGFGNCCKYVQETTFRAADFVMGAVPLLTNLLQYPDAKVLDVVFAAHVHADERSFSLCFLQYNCVFNGRSDPCGAAHIAIGDVGNIEGLAPRYKKSQPEWSVFQEASFGHAELRIVNLTHAYWSWHRNVDDEPVKSDSFLYDRTGRMGFAAHLVSDSGQFLMPPRRRDLEIDDRLQRMDDRVQLMDTRVTDLATGIDDIRTTLTTMLGDQQAYRESQPAMEARGGPIVAVSSLCSGRFSDPGFPYAFPPMAARRVAVNRDTWCHVGVKFCRDAGGDFQRVGMGDFRRAAIGEDLRGWPHQDIHETHEQLISRYIRGLYVSIQDVLNKFTPTSVSEAHQRALLVEQQQARKVGTSFTPSTNKPLGTSGTATSATKAPFDLGAPSEGRVGGPTMRSGNRQSNGPVLSKARGSRALFVEEPDSTVYDGPPIFYKEQKFQRCMSQETWVTRLSFVGFFCLPTSLSRISEPHPDPYALAWIQHDDSVRVTRRVLVTFSIGSSYNDLTWCDVVPMDSWHVLLGRPWQFDHSVVHNGHLNIYSFLFKGVHIVLHPSSSSSGPLPSSSLILFVSRAKQCRELSDSEDGRLMVFDVCDFVDKVVHDTDEIVDSTANPLHSGENDADEIALAYLDQYDRLRLLFKWRGLGLLHQKDSADPFFSASSEAHSKRKMLQELGKLACLRQRNLMSLRAYVFESGVYSLLYDYVSIGSLEDVMKRVTENQLELK